MTSTRRRADGFTLIEMAVTVMLMSIVGVIMFSFLDNITSTTARTSADVEAEKEAQLVLRRMSEDVRAATAIQTTYPATSSTSTCPVSALADPYSAGNAFVGYRTCLAFSVRTTQTNPSASCPRVEIRYGLNNGVIRRDQKTFDASCAVVASRTYTGQVIADNITSSVLFGYRNTIDADMLAGTPASPVDAHGIVISFSKRYRKNVNPLSFSTFVSLRNAR